MPAGGEEASLGRSGGVQQGVGDSEPEVPSRGNLPLPGRSIPAQLLVGAALDTGVRAAAGLQARSPLHRRAERCTCVAPRVHNSGQVAEPVNPRFPNYKMGIRTLTQGGREDERSCL